MATIKKANHNKKTLAEGVRVRAHASAKVRRPRLAHTYTRRRLFRILSDARKQNRIAWIAGPPGAGKTTLASSYVEQCGLPCMWYQIDEGDDDVASFFHYFTQAVCAATPRFRKPLPHLTPQHLPTVRMFARQYFQAVFARFPQGGVWVFDNYHTLRADSPLHDLLRENITDAQANVSVVFLSRNDPPPALARWQVHHHVRIVDPAELKLTLDEATGIARSLCTKSPRNDSIRCIHERTDGWAAGLVLLLERERLEPGGGEPTAPQALFSYFANEILYRLDQGTRRILLESALLPTMSTASLTGITGDARSAEVIADLARRNYFTVERAPTTYQYHALFRDFLLREINATYPAERVNALRREAASLLTADGYIEDAVDALRDAAAWEDLAQIIVSTAPSLAAQGRYDTLAHWIALVPADRLATSAWLLYWLAQCRLMTHPIESQQLSEKAFARFDAANDVIGLYLSWSSVVNALTIGWLSFTELDRWLGVFDTIQQRHPEFPTPETEARVTFSMMVILTNVPTSRPDIALWLARATALVQALPDVNQRLLIGASVTLYYHWIGDMKSVAALIEALEPVGARPDVAPIAAIPWRLVLAMNSWMTGRPQHSIEITEETLRLAAASGAHAMDLFLTMQGVYANLVTGDVKRASTYVAKLQGSEPAFLATYHHAATIVAIYECRLDKALEHSQRALTGAQTICGSFQIALAHLDHAWVHFQLARPAEARDHLEYAREIGRAMKSRLLECVCLMHEAGAALDEGKLDVAEDRLRSALAYDKDIGILGPIRPTREWTRLYLLALDRNIEVEHVRHMIRKRKLLPASPPLEVENWPWPYRIYTLGRLSIVKDDRAISLSGKGQKKPLELLKNLIAFGGRDVGQQKLTQALWPDAEGDAAQHAFETTLYRLRKLFGDDTPLVLKDGRLSLDVRTCWVDCWALERLASKIDEQAPSMSATELDLLTKKLFTLYRGPFLDREADAPLSMSLRERLRSRFLRALKDCGRIYETENAWDRAIDCYLQALEADPLAEVLYQHLMRAYHTLGRHAEALAVYSRCKNTLRELLGVAPSQDTESLRGALETAARGNA